MANLKSSECNERALAEFYKTENWDQSPKDE